MDALKIDKAHVVGHSMGAATALHVGIHYPERCILGHRGGCGYGSARSEDRRGIARRLARDRARCSPPNTMAVIAPVKYGDGPTRQAHKYKDPRGYAQFVKMLSEHSPLGHSLTMAHLQAKRPTLWDMEADLKKFKPPLLVLVGDEDDWCLDASVFLRRTAPTAGLMVVPRTGHTLTSEEPEKFNAALDDLFAECRSGTWISHSRAVTSTSG